MDLGTNRKLIFIFATLLAAAISGFGQSGRVQPTPTPTPDDDPVKVETEEVKVNVLAFDEDGRFVKDVTEKDLVITENNILHQATSVRRVPANVLIVMDTGCELRWVKSLDETRKVARGVLNSLRKEDSVALMQYADNATIVSEWTTDKEQINAAIGRTNFGRRSAFVDALKLAKEFMSNGDLENKHLVLITDGTDSSSDVSRKNAAFRNLLSTDIAVHVLSYTRMEAADIEPRTKRLSNSPPPKAMPDEIAATIPIQRGVKVGPTINMDQAQLKKLRARKDDLERSEEQLGTLVENTNGTFIVPDTLDEMEAKAATVAKMIDGSYVLTYIPKIPFAEKGGVRNIEVTSKRPGRIVQAKRKFVVPPKR